MPELPEVETVVRHLRAPFVGRTIQAAWTDWPPLIRSHAPADFAARLAGQRVLRLDRRAKYIIASLDADYLVLHLKMTGRLYVTAPDAVHDADRWVHLRLGLDNGQELRFSDSRKFGRAYLVADLDSITGGLGPEPLEDAFTLAVFRQRLAGRTRQLKALLLDQSFVAGLGNIYADEALFRAGIHPLRRADTLNAAEISALHAAIRAALQAGIDHEGASINWYRKPDGSKGGSQEHFYVYGRGGAPCLRCGTPIRKIRVAQRGTHFCPQCQPDPIAD